MTLDEILAQSKALMQKASDDAHRARLAFVSGNGRAYMNKVFEDTKKRIDEAYAAMDGANGDDNGTV